MGSRTVWGSELAERGRRRARQTQGRGHGGRRQTQRDIKPAGNSIGMPKKQRCSNHPCRQTRKVDRYYCWLLHVYPGPLLAAAKRTHRALCSARFRSGYAASPRGNAGAHLRRAALRSRCSVVAGPETRRLCFTRARVYASQLRYWWWEKILQRRQHHRTARQSCASGRAAVLPPQFAPTARSCSKGGPLCFAPIMWCALCSVHAARLN